MIHTPHCSLLQASLFVHKQQYIFLLMVTWGGGVDPRSACYFNENGQNKEKRKTAAKVAVLAVLAVLGVLGVVKHVDVAFCCLRLLLLGPPCVAPRAASLVFAPGRG